MIAHKIIGALLLKPSLWDTISQHADADDWCEYLPIIESIESIVADGQVIDPNVIDSRIDTAHTGLLSQCIKGMDDIIDTSDETITSYIGILKKQAQKKQILQLSNDLRLLASTNDDNIDEIHDKLYSAITGNKSEHNGRVHISDQLKSAFERIEKWQTGDNNGVMTGLSDLDSLTSGLQPGNNIVIAARPAMGKTSLACCILLGAAKNGTPGVFYSLEMPKNEVIFKLLSIESGVSIESMRNGGMNTQDWQEIANAAKRLQGLPLYIDDTASVTISYLANDMRRAHTFDNIGIAIIDYLQLITGGNPNAREAHIAETSRQIKILAKQLDIPVILLSQLNRAVETRVDKRPLLSDLRESGSIEQDADIVSFVYRHEYYEPYSYESRGVAELIIAKNRLGKTGTIELSFDGDTTTFRNLEKHRGEIDDYYR